MRAFWIVYIEKGNKGIKIFKKESGNWWKKDYMYIFFSLFISHLFSCQSWDNHVYHPISRLNNPFPPRPIWGQVVIRVGVGCFYLHWKEGLPSLLTSLETTQSLSSEISLPHLAIILNSLLPFIRYENNLLIIYIKPSPVSHLLQIYFDIKIFLCCEKGRLGIYSSN